MEKDYSDIINMPRPVSKTHPQMPVSERAAQFSPFAALTGYDEGIAEAARLTDEMPDIGDEKRAELDAKFSVLSEHGAESPEITVTFFIPDEKKEGGKLVFQSGRLRKIDVILRKAVLTDGTEIEIDRITDVDGKIFEGMI